jgi:hypothetical protein
MSLSDIVIRGYLSANAASQPAGARSSTWRWMQARSSG